MTTDELFKLIHETRTRQLQSGPSAADMELMEKIVLSSDEGARLYVRYMQDEANLVWSSSRDMEGGNLDDQSDEHADPLSEAAILPAIREPEFKNTEAAKEENHAEPISTYIAQRPEWHLPRHWLLGLGLAAAMLVSVVLLKVLLSSKSKDQSNFAATKIVNSPAVLEAAVNAQWDTADAGPQIGDQLPLAPITLKSGFASLKFDNGVSVIVEGPARIAVQTDNGIGLLDGKLSAVVPPAGHGFAVVTSSARIVDLGTEFGVAIQKDGATAVAVFKGTVRAEALTGTDAASSKTTMTEGQASVVSNGTIDVTEQHTSQRFVRDIGSKQVSLDVADLMAGGDGTSGKNGVMFDVMSGYTTEVGGPYTGDHVFHHADEIPIIDGCFLPDGSKGAMPVDSAGNLFLFPASNNQGSDRIWAGNHSPWPNDPFALILGDVNYSQGNHRLVHVPSNAGITLDLEAIRRLHPGVLPITFTAVVGNTQGPRYGDYQPKSDIFVLVDGHSRFAHPGLIPREGPVPIRFEIQPTDRFLTLAVTDGGDGNYSDWVVFGDPHFDCAKR